MQNDFTANRIENQVCFSLPLQYQIDKATIPNLVLAEDSLNFLFYCILPMFPKIFY